MCKKNTKEKKNKNYSEALVDKSSGLSRAEMRQLKLVADLLDEKSAVLSIVEGLNDRLYNLSAKPLNPVDRDMMALRLAILKAYAEVLQVVSNFENVRIRRQDGDYLNRNPVYLMHYLFGDKSFSEHRLCPDMPEKPVKTCSHTCNNCGKCAKSCKKSNKKNNRK